MNDRSILYLLCVQELLEAAGCGHYERAICNWTCGTSENETHLDVLLRSSPFTNITIVTVTPCVVGNTSTFICNPSDNHSQCELSCTLHETEREKDCLYGTSAFWGFVLLMSLGTIGFNVANSISDAVCFDVLGKVFSCWSV
jgi:hypothetical protein